MIHYSRQKIDNKDIKEVIKRLERILLQIYPTVSEFEKLYQKLFTKFAVATNSATSVLHVACLSLNIKKVTGSGHLQIVLFLQLIALFLWCKIDFVDIDKQTLICRYQN